MPPLLALLLCTVFVVVLLRLERRVSPDVSPALWIPTLWMLMIGSRPLAMWFDVKGDNESGSALDRFVLTGLTVAAMLVLARRKRNLTEILRQHKWLLVLLAYMLASTLWSDFTSIALRRWAREVIVLVMALLIVSEANPHQALASLLRRSAYVLIPFSLSLIKYYPALGRQYGRWSGVEMWTGVTGQKNMLGRLCIISIFFLLWALCQRWPERPGTGGRFQTWADVSVILIALYLLKGADSSTSLATLVVGTTTFLVLRLFRKLKLLVPHGGLLALSVFLIGFGTSAPFLGGSTVATFSTALNRDVTLTGRTEVWAAVLPAIQQQPLLGYGFGSFWTDARRELYEIPTAHNGYLDILLELGAVGLAFYTVWLLSCARQLHRALAQDYNWASLAICFLIMGLVYNATESALNTLTEHMTAAVVLTSFVVPACLGQKCTSNARVRDTRNALFPRPGGHGNHVDTGCDHVDRVGGTVSDTGVCPYKPH
jgi:exopolysaccharide production protein ExoQ